MYMESRDPTLSTFDFPIPAMNRTDADVGIIVLWMNNVQYTEPVDDPMFSAHELRTYTSGGENVTMYGADKPAGVFGCAIQVHALDRQLCLFLLTAIPVPILFCQAGPNRLMHLFGRPAD